MSDFDDLSVFLLTIPESLVEGREEKYNTLIGDVKECKQTAKSVLKKLIMRQKFP